MYRFIDTVDRAEDAELPKEALSFGGTIFELVIPGYRTLSVLGRESFEAEITALSSPQKDGQSYVYSRKKERHITVHYQLISEDETTFRQAFNILLGYLMNPESQLIFMDEPDKYFTGTVTSIDNPPPGCNAVTASFVITCSDPFKYSIKEYEVDLAPGEKTNILYGGTVPSFPVIYSTINASYGSISAVMSNGGNIVLGIQDEPPEGIATSQKGVYFKSFANGLVINPDDESCEWTYASVDAHATIQKYLYTFNFTSVDYGFPGIGIKRDIPLSVAHEDFNGWYGAEAGIRNEYFIGTDFDVETRIHFGIHDSIREMGYMEICVPGALNANGGDTSKTGTICAVVIYKTTNTSSNATVSLVVNTMSVKRFTVDVSDESVATSRVLMRKRGDVFHFECFGIRYDFTSSVSNTRVPGLVSIFAAIRSFNALTDGGETYPSCYPYLDMSFGYLKLTDIHSSYLSDESNKKTTFLSGQDLSIDTGKGEIQLDYIDRPDLGTLTNNWEQSCLVPGDNGITVIGSEWASDPISASLKYREVYL
jgi:predicted phage tail component-like protein